MEYYPKYPAHYRTKTWDLSLAEHGAYNLLIDWYMHNESPIPDDDIAIAGILGKPLEEWIAVAPKVRAKFKKKGAFLRNTKCENVLESAFEKRNDGKTRQKRYRNSLKNKDTVTRDKRVSNALKERKGKERKEEPPLVPLERGKNGKTMNEIFEEFWTEYPRKTGKKNAAKIFERIIKLNEATPAELIQGVRQYASDRSGQDQTYTKHPATWLNGECWKDEPEPPRQQEFGNGFSELIAKGEV